MAGHNNDQILEMPFPIDLTAVDPNNAQSTEVRFMALGSNGDLYTVFGRYTVQRWRRGETVPRDTYTARQPINAFVLRDIINSAYTHAFLAHDRGEITVLKHRNFGPKRDFRPQSTLQTASNRFGFNEFLSVVRSDNNNNNPAANANTITCLCLSEGHEFLYAASTKGVIYVYWIGTDGGNKFAGRIPGHDDDGEAVSLAAGPHVVFSGLSDGRVRMYRRVLRGRHEVRHTNIGWSDIADDPVRARATALVFEARAGDQTRGRLYGGCTDGRVRCWKDLHLNAQAAWPQPELMQHHTGAVTCVALCSDRFVCSGSNDGRICVWRRGAENTNHTIERVFEGRHNPIKCVVAQKDTWAEFPDEFPQRWYLYGGSLDAIRKWQVNLGPLDEVAE